jgi:Holliday junction resolvase RusA-like endonuclease
VKKWSVTLPSPPPSWNNSYHIVRATRYRANGSRYSFSTLAKTDKLVEWQEDMVLVVRAAKPSHWQPEGWVRIYWRVFLSRHIDMDNLQKATNDVIESATGVNDKWFLPIFQEDPHIGVPRRDARIELVIEG